MCHVIILNEWSCDTFYSKFQQVMWLLKPFLRQYHAVPKIFCTNGGLLFTYEYIVRDVAKSLKWCRFNILKSFHTNMNWILSLLLPPFYINKASYNIYFRYFSTPLSEYITTTYTDNHCPRQGSVFVRAYKEWSYVSVQVRIRQTESKRAPVHTIRTPSSSPGPNGWNRPKLLQVWEQIWYSVWW